MGIKKIDWENGVLTIQLDNGYLGIYKCVDITKFNWENYGEYEEINLLFSNKLLQEVK